MPHKKNTPEQFWQRVVKTDQCWLWQGRARRGGYGVFRYHSSQKIPAHRVAWELTYGPIPEGLLVCHKCDNRICVRPDHLFLGTHKDNIADCIHKGRFPQGGNKKHARLTEADVRDIRRKYDSGITQRILGAEYAVDQAHISQIVLRKRWKDVD